MSLTHRRGKGFGMAIAALAATMPLGLVSFGATSGQGAGTTAPTYVKDIAPILHRKCISCHQPDGAGPFPFLTYEQVRKHAPLIRIQVLSGAMPPGLVQSEVGALGPMESLDEREIILLQRWYGAQMPRGEGPEPVAELHKGWRIGTPDAVVKGPAKPMQVRAEGAPYWQTFVMDWPKSVAELQRFEVRPKHPGSLRYAVVGVVGPGSKGLGRVGKDESSLNLTGDDVIGVWAPGWHPWRTPEGAAKRIANGSKLVVHAFYQPSGRPVDAGFEIGLVRGKGSTVASSVVTLEEPAFLVPAEDTRQLTLEHAFAEDTRLFGLMPEARFFCSRITVRLHVAGREPEILFETYKWNPYTLGNYAFPKPVLAPAGSRVEATFSYNNDENCIMNQGKKPQDVRSGRTLGDELCRLHLFVAQ